MGVNLFVRKSFNANDLKRAVNEHLDPKIRALRKDKQLANRIADEWALAVTRFVPRSNRNVAHHLQDYSVSDGRVVWTRKSKTYGEIAGELYEGPIHGKEFHVRTTGATAYGPHEPQEHWDDNVRPGTADWDIFVERITPKIIEWVKNNNG